MLLGQRDEGKTSQILGTYVSKLDEDALDDGVGHQVIVESADSVDGIRDDDRRPHAFDVVGDDGLDDTRVELLEAAVRKIENGQIGEAEDLGDLTHLGLPHLSHLLDGVPEPMSLLGRASLGQREKVYFMAGPDLG